jgi:hypothetical protein
MEEEKSQPPPHHQLEQAEEVEAIVTTGAAGADAPIYDVYMDEEEEEKMEAKEEGKEEEAEVKEADPQGIDAAAAAAAPIYDEYIEEKDDVLVAEEADRAAAIAADEEMAHRLYMQDLMEMEEWQLRDMDRPSLRRAPLDLPLSDFSSSSRSGVGFPAYSSSSRAGVGGNFRASTPHYALNPMDPVVPRQAGGSGIFERFREIRTAPSASNGGIASSLARPEAERESVFLPRAVTMGANRGAGTNTTSGFMRPGPRDFATTPARQTVLFKDAAGSSSTQHVPGDGKTSAVPSEALAPASIVPSARCCATARLARPTVPANNDGPVSTKRRALLADADSAMIFAGMEEGDNNGWYESIVVPDDDEEPEQVEMQGLNESLQLCLPRSEPCNPAATVAEGHEFSLQDFCQKWGVTPSDVNPDEPGPSTRAPKVPPLADDEVATFDCGICMDTLPVFDLFHGLPCKHKFCAPCMTTYVEGRIRSTELPIPCPDPACGRAEGGGRGVLHPEKCKKAIDYGAFVDWGARLTESALPADRRAYCPNRRCGVLLETSSGPAAKAHCPACGEALCATCGMEWSSDGTGEHDCAKGPGAALVRKLAQDRRWKQCPRCKMYVERIDGCNRMTCRYCSRLMFALST